MCQVNANLPATIIRGGLLCWFAVSFHEALPFLGIDGMYDLGRDESGLMILTPCTNRFAIGAVSGFLPLVMVLRLSKSAEGGHIYFRAKPTFA